MSANTSIEWTDRTWNPLIAVLKRKIQVKLKSGKAREFAAGTRGWFCTKCSEGCANCYAETFNFRLGNGLLYSAAALADVEFKIAHLSDPFRWRKPQLVFVNSMTDLFHDAVPVHLIDDVFAVMAIARHTTFQILTKRAKKMRDYFAAPDVWQRIDESAWRLTGQSIEMTAKPLPNVWLGVSVENQKHDDRVLELLATPAAVRFLSCEPLLGPLNARNVWDDDNNSFDALTGDVGVDGRGHTGPTDKRIHWVIAGGESGPKARPMHPDWVRALRDQCAAAHVPFLFKQWGEYRPAVMKELDGDISFPSVDCPRTRLHQFPDGTDMLRIGKKAAGRVLDGIEHNAFPLGYERTLA